MEKGLEILVWGFSEVDLCEMGKMILLGKNMLKVKTGFDVENFYIAKREFQKPPAFQGQPISPI